MLRSKNRWVKFTNSHYRHINMDICLYISLHMYIGIYKHIYVCIYYWRQKMESVVNMFTTINMTLFSMFSMECDQKFADIVCACVFLDVIKTHMLVLSWWLYWWLLLTRPHATSLSKYTSKVLVVIEQCTYITYTPWSTHVVAVLKGLQCQRGNEFLVRSEKPPQI